MNFQRKVTGTRVPGAQLLGKYEVLLVPVTGISKPGNTREYPGNWQKGNTSRGMRRHFHFEKGFLENIIRNTTQGTLFGG